MTEESNWLDGWLDGYDVARKAALCLGIDIETRQKVEPLVEPG